MRNPFTPTFGSIPPFMAGRETILHDIERGFDNGPGDPNLSTIFTGARGTGKTALLSYLSQEARGHGWISADVSAVPGMLEDILERANESAREFVAQKGRVQVNTVKVGPVSVGWNYREPEGANWRTRMNALFDELTKHGIGLLITVDEVRVDLDEMVQLASVYQHFVREGRNVALLMAGLPYKVSMLLRDDSISFLRRAQQHHLGRIADYEIASALEKTVQEAGRSIGSAAIEEAVKDIDGFPYMMQLVGYRAWDARPDACEITKDDVKRGSELARMEIRDRILETTYRELSEGDLRFLRAMLPDEGDSRVADIAKRMGVTSNYAGEYKRRLLEDGVIGERGRGRVGFDLPAFKEFLLEKN